MTQSSLHSIFPQKHDMEHPSGQPKTDLRFKTGSETLPTLSHNLKTHSYDHKNSPSSKSVALASSSPFLTAFRSFINTLMFFTPALPSSAAATTPADLPPSAVANKPSSHVHLPHLDGLRAVALFGVLLFHFEVPHTQGGFAGVDVFLSLSGFLITRNIIRDLSAGTFSLRRFYTRRFFRLYPAATTVVAASIAMAFFIFPHDLALSAVESAISSMAFSSNIYFHLQEGYFDNSAVLKPLLHTWSLSLEEQFYFLWAPMLVLVSLFRRPMYASVIMMLTFISLIAAVTMSVAYPSFVFYQLPPRIFQFALGAILSTMKLDIAPGFLPEVLATTSLSAIVMSFFFLPKGAGPLQMLPTTIATCLLIALPNTTVSNTVLADPLARLVGRLSYAAYLVHWPVYVYIRHMMSALSLGKPLPLMLVAITMALAWVLHHSVEQPGRHGASKMRPRLAVLLLVISTASLCLFGLQTKGFSFRTRELAGSGYPGRVGRAPPKLYKHCKDKKVDKKSRVATCRVGDTKRGERSAIAFFGDSFTQQLVIGLSRVGVRRGNWFEVRFRTGCRFSPRSARFTIKNHPDEASGSSKDCVAAHDRMWKDVESLPKGSVVAVSNAWWWRSVKHQTNTLTELDRDIRALGHTLLIVEEPPGMDEAYASYFDCADLATMPLGRIIAKLTGQEYRGAARCADVTGGLPPFEGRAWQNDAYHELFTTKLPNVEFIDFFSYMCRTQNKDGEGHTRCTLPANTQGIVYDIGYRRDMRHLTEAGSYFMSNILEKQLYGEDDPPKGL